jgi:hypothetical protein
MPNCAKKDSVNIYLGNPNKTVFISGALLLVESVLGN